MCLVVVLVGCAAVVLALWCACVGSELAVVCVVADVGWGG